MPQLGSFGGRFCACVVYYLADLMDWFLSEEGSPFGVHLGREGDARSVADDVVLKARRKFRGGFSLVENVLA